MAASNFDRALLSENVRAWRRLRGFSQAELAARSGVGITTVYKAETGRPVRMGLLLKIIEHGLGGSFEECSSTPRLTNSKPDDALYVKHHSIQTRWFVYGDRRRRVPESNLDLIQDEHERIRLGQLGLATLFGCGTDYIMPRGPGILFYEVHGSTDQVSQNYQDAIYLALRGSVLITIRGEAIRLDEGESIGCSGREVVSFALPEDSRAKGPSLVQFIGANRIGKVIGRNRTSQGIV